MFKVGDEVMVKPGSKFGIVEYNNLLGQTLRVQRIHEEEKWSVHCWSNVDQDLFCFNEEEIIHAKPLTLEDLI